MSISPQTRKPAGLLTTDDFAAFPVWEYADDEEGMDGRDETWVHPSKNQAVTRASYVLVASRFRASCGREYAGYLHVSRLDGPAEVSNGAIFVEDGPLLIPEPNHAMFDRAMVELLDGLRLSESQLFPIAYDLQVPFDNEFACRSGVLTGRLKRSRRHPGENQKTFWECP